MIAPGVKRLDVEATGVTAAVAAPVIGSLVKSSSDRLGMRSDLVAKPAVAQAFRRRVWQA
jgi:hypothetical protein